MKKNLELILLVGNWVVVAIQAFTIFLYGNSIGLFIIMLLALIVVSDFMSCHQIAHIS